MTVFKLKQLASTSAHAVAGAVRWNYDRAELIADGIVHGIGGVGGAGWRGWVVQWVLGGGALEGVGCFLPAGGRLLALRVLLLRSRGLRGQDRPRLSFAQLISPCLYPAVPARVLS